MAIEPRESLGFAMENPFSLKVGQIFTGFGIGCGIGIGVGRPIYLAMDFGGIFKGKDGDESFKCSIPMMQQVMSATRGATDAFSGVGHHVNSSLRKVGMKNIEAGVGCGVGIGHGFGVGIALKPGVVNRIQSSILQAVTKLILNMGLAPSLSSMQNVVPVSVQSSLNALTSNSGGNVQSSIGGVMHSTSKNRGSDFHLSRSNESVIKPKGLSDGTVGSRTEKVLDNFLQSPIFKNEDDTFNELADKLRSENNVLQVLLKQQQAIQGLMEENKRLQRILVEDLKVSPSKLHANNDRFIISNNQCSSCFDCRRRMRKSGR